MDTTEGGGYGELARLRTSLAALFGGVGLEGEGLVGGRGVVIFDDGEGRVEGAEGVSELVAEVRFSSRIRGPSLLEGKGDEEGQ